MLKYNFSCPEQFVAAVDGVWLPTQGVKFDFKPNGEVEVSITDSIHDSLLIEHFWEPNGGKSMPINEAHPS